MANFDPKLGREIFFDCGSLRNTSEYFGLPPLGWVTEDKKSDKVADKVTDKAVSDKVSDKDC